MRQRQHLEHSPVEHLVQHVLADHGAEGVEHRLRPGLHLLALGAGEIAEVLPADRVDRPEHHDLAVRATLHDRLEPRAQRQRRLPGTGPSAQRDDADVGIEQQVEGDPLFGRTPMQPECLLVAPHQPDPLVGGHPPQGAGTTREQPQPGVARHPTDLLEPEVHRVDRAGVEQRVDQCLRHVHVGHPGPAGRRDLLGAVLISVQPDRTRFDPQRDVLRDQGDSWTLDRQVQRTGQDPVVVGVCPEAGRKHRRVRMVQLHLKRSAVVADRNRRVEPAILPAQVIEHAKSFTSKPA